MTQKIEKVVRRTQSPEEGHATIRDSFLRRLAKKTLDRPIRVSGNSSLAESMRTELLRYANGALQKVAEQLRDDRSLRRHVVTVNDVDRVVCCDP